MNRRGAFGGSVVAVLALVGSLVMAVGGPVAPASAAGVAVERVAGADRYVTAISVSQRGWPSGASGVVIVGGRDHRDALAAAGLAGLKGRIPVLLTPSGEGLRDDVRAEVARLAPKAAWIVGGEAAVSAAAEAGLSSVVGSVTRLSGDDAFATAASVATSSDGFGGVLPQPARGAVFVVNPGDAMSGVLAGSVAAGRGVPVLLTAVDAVPSSTAAALSALKPTTTYVVGGPGAVSDAVLASFPGARRIAEADPFGTGVAMGNVAGDYGFNLRHAVLTGAGSWPDAVAAAPLAGAMNAPLLLVPAADWHGRLSDWFANIAPVGATIVGGDAAVDPLVASLVAEGGVGGLGRGPGAHGPVVSRLQQMMVESGFNPARTDGVFDTWTRFGVYALQKAFGLPATGAIGGAELDHLRRRDRAPVLRPDITASHGDHVEISLARQLVQVVRGGVVELSVHTSTGKPSTPTITGLFRILDHRPGFNATHMYMTMHFRGGYAIHGYDPVPLGPASHGCARVGYRDAELLYRIVPNGMPVIVWR